jgi:predicted HAD superfamily Cof-like phosphohydrolase
MDQTNYQKVVEFNKTFGHPAHDTVQINVWSDPRLIKLRVDLIKEEVQELQDAVKNHDMVETVDALADILYVVYGMGAAFGIDLDRAMGLVHESNMTKVCDTEEDAIKTVDWYKDKFAKGELSYDTPNYRPSANNDGKWIVFNESTGKILKNIKYKQVSFDSMLN